MEGRIRTIFNLYLDSVTLSCTHQESTARLLFMMVRWVRSLAPFQTLSRQDQVQARLITWAVVGRDSNHGRQSIMQLCHLLFSISISNICLVADNKQVNKLLVVSTTTNNNLPANMACSLPFPSLSQCLLVGASWKELFLVHLAQWYLPVDLAPILTSPAAALRWVVRVVLRLVWVERCDGLYPSMFTFMYLLVCYVCPNPAPFYAFFCTSSCFLNTFNASLPTILRFPHSRPLVVPSDPI